LIPLQGNWIFHTAIQLVNRYIQINQNQSESESIRVSIMHFYGLWDKWKSMSVCSCVWKPHPPTSFNGSTHKLFAKYILICVKFSAKDTDELTKSSLYKNYVLQNAFSHLSKHNCSHYMKLASISCQHRLFEMLKKYHGKNWFLCTHSDRFSNIV